MKTLTIKVTATLDVSSIPEDQLPSVDELHESFLEEFKQEFLNDPRTPSECALEVVYDEAITS